MMDLPLTSIPLCLSRALHLTGSVVVCYGVYDETIILRFKELLEPIIIIISSDDKVNYNTKLFKLQAGDLL